jgi:hypothetical protein
MPSLPNHRCLTIMYVDCDGAPWNFLARQELICDRRGLFPADDQMLLLQSLRVPFSIANTDHARLGYKSQGYTCCDPRRASHNDCPEATNISYNTLTAVNLFSPFALHRFPPCPSSATSHPSEHSHQIPLHLLRRSGDKCFQSPDHRYVSELLRIPWQKYPSSLISRVRPKMRGVRHPCRTIQTFAEGTEFPHEVSGVRVG